MMADQMYIIGFCLFVVVLVAGIHLGLTDKLDAQRGMTLQEAALISAFNKKLPATSDEALIVFKSVNHKNYEFETVSKTDWKIRKYNEKTKLIDKLALKKPKVLLVQTKGKVFCYNQTTCMLLRASVG